MIKNFSNKLSHQRLNAQHYEHFCQWLIGFTEGDGCFFVETDAKKTKFVIGFKIALHKNDIGTLIYIQKNLNCGKLSWANKTKTMIQYRIRNRRHFMQSIIPIFDKYPMLTHKWHDYQIIRKIAFLLNGNKETFFFQEIKDLQIELNVLREARKTENSSYDQRLRSNCHKKEYCEKLGISATNETLSYLQKNKNNKEDNLTLFYRYCWDVSKSISFFWIVGFLEAEGSFYITKKTQNRYCHGFGITQKTPFILEVLRYKYHFPTKIQQSQCQLENKTLFFKLDTTNFRVLQKVKKIFRSQFIGLKSLQFKIWTKSMNHRNHQYQLMKAQKLLRKLSKN